MKKYRRIISHDTDEWCKVWRKLALGCISDMANLVNVNTSSGKSENLHFDVLLFSIAYKVSDKICRRVISWHWRVIQTLKKNSLLIWKMTWIIWWILTRAAENLKICTKVCNVWVKKIGTSCVVKNDIRFQKWHNEFGEFSQ